MRLRDWDQNLKIRLAGESVVNITFWMFFPFLAIYFTDSFGKSTAGLLLILSQVVSCAANLLGGYYADKYGRKRMMVLSAFAQGAAFTVFAFSSSPWLDSALLGFVCFTVVSMFGAVYWPASQAMIADVVEEKDRSDVFAIFYTSTNIAVVIGPIIGGIFFADYRFALLLMAGVLNLVLGIVLHYKITETAPVSKMEESGQASNWISVLGDQLKDYKVIMNDRIFLLFIIAGVLVGQTFMQLDLLFPVYINEVVTDQPLLQFGNWSYVVESTQAFGLVLAENGLLVAIFTITVTRWMSKYKERNVFIISSFIYAASVLLFSQTSWIWGLLLAMLVFTLAELMTAGIQQGFISELAPADKRGKYYAAASLRYTFSKMIAPLSIPMSAWVGYTWTFFFISLLAILSGVIYYRLFVKFEQRKMETAPKW
ncbi:MULTISPECIES: MDR family MFS transporter [Bacillaceae]|uniref:MDR family MFS transporter n=1 Tax=Bacillaceae TaxID=186817 RepID=UPI001E3D7466|nr:MULTISPECIES: MFS transporter [Bacillaceae]MCE4051340.1 MFS transporter [Bacillus sp. Au-Bac7]MCM3029241.1 MFS transporter [Niallia sp. MER 6]MDL0437501.1 MFS transporter [Niallia sp. SS-2023]